MKNDPIQAKLEALGAIDPGTAQGQQLLEKALADRSNLVVTKAAKVAAEAKLVGNVDALRKAFDRFLAAPESDKGCAALTALSAALVEFDYDEPEPFVAGIRHVQMEPVFGGKVDAAPDLRANCAIGLVNTRYPRVLDALATLLADLTWRGRAGAVRALAATGSDAAAALVRFKALIGDEEREVLVECFSALLLLDETNVPFIAERMSSKDADTEEAAILALGTSRHEAAFEALRKKLSEPRLGPLRGTVLIALASMRLEAAVELVKDLARKEDRDARKILAELRISL